MKKTIKILAPRLHLHLSSAFQGCVCCRGLNLDRTHTRLGAFSLDHSFSPFHKLEKISVKENSLVRNLKKKAAYTIHLITFYRYNLYLLFNENSFIDFHHYTDNRTLTQKKKPQAKSSLNSFELLQILSF